MLIFPYVNFIQQLLMLMTKFVVYFLKNHALKKLKTSFNIDICVLPKPISPINKTYIYFPFPSKLITIFT
jgi:hypothetical protein